ncbi:hypothetical protein [Ruegeria atlantica]|uniref:hypothetical protein n=1 Tax=Ruegeria atlantica TaxID=81569 RepID=UPI0020C22757|nr:hypothetical protein [Ruegeria atlantica]
MRITKITLWSVDLTSHETYHMAEGKSCATVKSHILCLETDTGLKGWGEVCPIPHYLPAYADGVPAAVTEMGPEILGMSPFGVDAPMRKLDGFLLGHRYAKSMVDIALWDLFGQASGQPVYALLGGGGRARTCRFIIRSPASRRMTWRGSPRQPIRPAFVSFRLSWGSKATGRPMRNG